MKTLTAAVFGVALALCLTPAASADTAGLVAAYGFEEATGTAAVDSSGAGNAGVVNGATRSASGRFGAGASFDGVNDRIDIADSNSLDLSSGMTLEAWVNPTALGWRTAIMKERPGGIAYALYASTDSNRPSAEIQAETRAPAAIPQNLWTHLASTYDGATLRLYVNGGQVASRAVSGPLTISSGALRIGGNAVWGEYFKGLIDEVRVYNRALTAGELQVDMNTAIVSADTQPPTAPALTATLAQDDVQLAWSGATDNVGITGYRVFRDGTLLTTLPTGTISYDDLDRPFGTYRYTVRAIDAAGNVGALSNEVVVSYVDPDAGSPTAPVLTGTGTSGFVHLTWTAATDDLGVKEYRVYRDGTLIGTRDGAATRAWDDLHPPSNRSTYTVAAVDNAGHSTSSAEVTVTIPIGDGTPPVVTIDSCTGDTVHDHFLVRGSFTDNVLGSVSGRLEVDGQLVTTDIGKVLGPGYLWETRTLRTPDGPHVMKMFVVDAAGNQGVGECVWNVDNYDVTAAVVAPAAGTTVSGTITLDADVFTDGEPIAADWSNRLMSYFPASVRFAIDGSDTAGAPQTNSLPFQASYDTTRMTNGPHTVQARVFWMDYGIVRATSETVTFNVDNSPPRPTGVTAGAIGADVLVAWNAVTANPAVTGYRVYRNGTEIATVTDTAYTDADRPPGSYDYTVAAVNSRGASGQSEKASVTLGDTTPPTVSLGACDGTKVHDYIDLRPSVSDDFGPMTARVLLDGDTIWGPYTVSAPRFQFVWDPRRDGVPNGMHTMTVVVRDGAGNETSVPCEWNVQNPTVTVPFTSPADGATVSGTVDLAAQVLTDGEIPDWTGWLPAGNPVTGVAFEVVGKSSQFDSAAPYQVAWDSTTVPNGTYTVRASVSWMDYSLPRATNEIQITVDNPVPLPAPTGVAPNVTGDDVTLTWNAVDGAARYRVQRNGSDVGTTSGTSFTDADVPVGTHQYRVIAEDATRTSVPSAAVSATIAPPPPSGLVAAYGFEQTSGTSVTDSSGKGSTGTLSGATWAAGGKFGRALSFDGVNDIVTVPDSNLLDLAPGMTLEAWVKPTTTSDWRTVLLKERPGQLTYALYATGDNGRSLTEVAAGSQRDARGTAALPVGVWTHLAATYDNATLRLYVNGVQVSSTAVTGTLVNSTGALRIGGNNVWGEYFGGLIDEVRVYERALSAAEIAADKDRAV